MSHKARGRRKGGGGVEGDRDVTGRWEHRKKRCVEGDESAKRWPDAICPSQALISNSANCFQLGRLSSSFLVNASKWL